MLSCDVVLHETGTDHARLLFLFLTTRRDTDYTKNMKVSESIQFVYRANICHNTIQPCKNDKGAVTESLRIPAGETCRVWGRLENYKVEDMAFPSTDENPHGEGIRIKYSGGDTCDAPQATKKEAWVEVECSVSQPGAGVLVEVLKSEQCRIVLKMKSTHACSVAMLGWGMSFLTLFFVTITIYCIGGALLNYKMYGRHGVDMIPHHTFWVEFPGLVKEGFLFTKGELMRRGVGNGSYGAGDIDDGSS